MKNLTVNIYGGPGCGKSTRINYIASILKLNGILCEVCSEFAKDEIHKGCSDNLKDQKYIFGNQQHLLKKLTEIYPIIINDGTLMNCIMYDLSGDNEFHNVIYKTYKEFNNLNYFIERDKDIKFVQEGRVHSYEESLEKDKEILKILEKYDESYESFDVKKIINTILDWYNENVKQIDKNKFKFYV